MVQWMILDPIFMEGNNSVGIYSMIGSWMAFGSLLIVLFIAFVIVIRIKDEKSDKKRKNS